VDSRKLDKEMAEVEKAVFLKEKALQASIHQSRAEVSALLSEVDDLLEEDSALVPPPAPLIPVVSQALVEPLKWESALDMARKTLELNSINSQGLTSFDLLTPEELTSINQQLNRPMYERLAWDKWDYIMAFGAGIAGGALDIFVGTPGHGLQKMMGDKDTWIGSTMEKIHGKHATGAPIDYQGDHFRGGDHRGRTTGHDLLRPLEGIRQFMDGTFRGSYWYNGQQFTIESATNQYGNPYDTMGMGSAAFAWMTHMACDFFSSKSLPIPGTSYLNNIDSHAVRHFVQEDLYKHGVNLKHLALQTLPPLLIEVAIRIYVHLRYRKMGLHPEALEQKKIELLAVAHGTCTAFNVGKVILMEDPTLLNMPQIMALARTLFKLWLAEFNRNALSRKVERNVQELQVDLKVLHQRWEMDLEKGIPKPIIL
jgi:hypothetical protein